MATIPNEEKVFMVSNGTNTTYSGSASLKAMQEWYTMQDIIDTVLGSIEGTSYIYVAGNGTKVENYDELNAAIAFASTAEPYGNPLAADNRFTIIVAPGDYGQDTIELSVPYIDVRSLTGECDIICGEGFSILSDDVNVNGVDAVDSQFLLTSGVGNISISNCKGGDKSFGDAGDGDFSLSSCNFVNCIAGSNSFGTMLNGCTFTNCTAKDFSFGWSNQNIKYDSSDNTFTNCTAGENSFIAFDQSSVITPDRRFITFRNTFTNCNAGSYSFIYGVTSHTSEGYQAFDNTFNYCSGGNNCFISGRFAVAQIIGNKFNDLAMASSSCISFDVVFGEVLYNINNNSFFNCHPAPNTDIYNCFINIANPNGESFYVDPSVISYNTIDSCSVTGYSFIYLDSNANVEILSNSFNNCIDRYDGSSFIYGTKCDKTIIVNDNKFSNLSSSGLSYISFENGTGSLAVDSNTFRNCTTSGYSFIYAASKTLTVRNNKFYDCTMGEGNGFVRWQAPDLSDIEVEVLENYFSNCNSESRAFIYLVANPVNFDPESYENISDNKFLNCRTNKGDSFIYLDGLHTTEVSGNEFYDCVSARNSFIYSINTSDMSQIVNSLFSGCVSGENSFMCILDDITDITGNNFYSCISDLNSFLYLQTSVATIGDHSFIDCTSSGDNSFLATYPGINIIDAIYFRNCVSGNLSFMADILTSGAIPYSKVVCTHCTAGIDSFGRNGITTSSSLYYCKSGSNFPTTSLPGVTRYCVNGNNITNNQN